jgi:flagellar basal-body rod protein FlgF
MIKGIYTSAMAMRQGILRQEMTANNLANAGTNGFKRDRLFTEDLVKAQGQTLSTDPLAIKSHRWTEFTPGSFDPTGNSLDFALQGEGFFVVSDGTKEVYTRNGHFERGADGTLVDSQGRTVQGEGGNILLPAGTIGVSSEGRLSVDGAPLDKLRVVNVDNPQTLRKVAGSAFERGDDTTGEVPVPTPGVRQGFLETSNVDTVKEMVEMISTARNYEVNAKLLTTQDGTLQHTVNELGRV